MTAVLDDLDLAGIGLQPACDVPVCLTEARFIAWWSEPCCGKASRATLLCGLHGELVRELASADDATFTCDHCGSERQLERLEPIR